jgi:nicastrin
MFQSMRVPMFSCRDSKTSEALLTKALDNGARQFAYPQWGALLNAHMDASINAETCLRRGFCQPLGGESVWAARRPLVRPDAPDPIVDGNATDSNATDRNAARQRSKRPIVLLSAAMDSQALFQDEAVGARSEMAALVIALATLDSLATSNVSDAVWDAAPRQPLFAFFTGEAWNQMGSKQFFRDVAGFECKQPDAEHAGVCYEPFVTSRDFQDIALDNVAFMMHLASDLGVGERQEVFWHVGNASDSVLGARVRAELALSIDVRSPSPAVTTLPPSALVSARRHRAALPGVVLGGFDDRFNARYHSRLDDARGASTKWLCPTALAVARSFAAALLTNDSSAVAPPRNNSVLEAIEVNCTLVDALWHCLVEDALCELTRTMLQIRARTDAAEPRPTHYVGVHSKGNGARGHWAPFINVFAAMRFKQRTGKECGVDPKIKCAESEQCIMNACVYANVHYHDALPDGLAFSVADNAYVVLPTGDIWVESNWDSIGIRLFKRSSEGASIALLVFGIVLVVGSFAALVVGKKKAAKAFKLL